MGRKSLKRTAYHEAGHAVMALALRCRFRHISIIPDDNQGTLGHVLQGKIATFDTETRDPSSKMRYHLERLALVSLAGNAAECLFTDHKIKTGSGSDFSHACLYLNYLTPDEDELLTYGKWLIERAKVILSSSWNWYAVETLAKELLKKKYMGRKIVYKIVKDAWKESVYHVRENQS
jgi:hypothetical protein